MTKEPRGGTWPRWRDHYWQRYAHKRARREKLDEAAQQIEDSLDDADEEARRNREQDHAEILAAGYVLNEDGVYVRPTDASEGKGEPHP